MTRIDSPQGEAPRKTPDGRFWTKPLLSTAYRGVRPLLWIQVALWVWLFFKVAAPCADGRGLWPYGLWLLSIGVCITLWLNHVAAIRTSVPGIGLGRAFAKGVTLDLLAVFAGFLLVTIPLAILLLLAGPPACYSPAERQLAGLMLYASGFTEEISLRTLKRGSVVGSGAGLRVETSELVRGGLVTGDGAVIVFGEDTPSLVMLEPRVEGDHVVWKCSAYSDEVVRVGCGDRYQPFTTGLPKFL